MTYISRNYLREKWEAAKWDIEKVLDINNEDLDDCIEEDLINRTRGNTTDKLTSIINEVNKH